MKRLIAFVCIVAVIYLTACKKDKEPEPADPRDLVVGTYFCSYTGHQVMGDSGWDISGTETVRVESIASTPGALSITPMVGATVILQEDMTFFNSRSKGLFRNDSIRLYTYATPAAITSTFFTGKKN